MDHWFDAHLDFTYLAGRGRDFTLPLSATNGGPQPVGLTFPSLRDGRVAWALGTIYISINAPPGDPCGYRDSADADGAFESAVKQLRLYQAWESQDKLRLVRCADELRMWDPDAHASSGGAGGSGGSGGELMRIAILMEGADPIRSPEEARWWFAQGVRVVGLAWSKGTRYAGGEDCAAPNSGLTDAGRQLIRVLDELGVILDFTHLHDDAAKEALDLTERPVIATHSSSRALHGSNKMRLIPDDIARAIGQRGGVIGLPLYSPFLCTDSPRATITQCIDHVERLADLAGGRNRVGLGSDMDGGFGADKLPQGMKSPVELDLLADELQRRGWSDEEVRGFRRENWLRFFREHLAG